MSTPIWSGPEGRSGSWRATLQIDRWVASRAQQQAGSPGFETIRLSSLRSNLTVEGTGPLFDGQ